MPHKNENHAAVRAIEPQNSAITGEALSQLLSEKIKPVLQQDGVIAGLVLASFAWQQAPASAARWESFAHDILARLVQTTLAARIDSSALIANPVADELTSAIMAGFTALQAQGLLEETSAYGDSCPYFQPVRR